MVVPWYRSEFKGDFKLVSTVLPARIRTDLSHFKGYIYITAVNDTLVRGVYIYRIYLLSKCNRVLAIFLSFVCLLSFGFGIAVAAKSVAPLSIGLSNLYSFSFVIYLGLSTLAMGDVIIAAALCVLLRRQMIRTNRIYSITRSLILYGINASALTSILSVTPCSAQLSRVAEKSNVESMSRSGG
ncbi:hypothetical protein QCA50_003333 [Cerrena zonata]|uniref:DUF6534 domain-containing protein n=1 Tax=Cerrena zonata TaxID=2478898 RepID=A0AAW0GLY8_9APHY